MALSPAISCISTDDDCDSCSCRDCCNHCCMTVLAFIPITVSHAWSFGAAVACCTLTFESTDLILARSSFIFPWAFSWVPAIKQWTSVREIQEWGEPKRTRTTRDDRSFDLRVKNGVDLAMIKDISDDRRDRDQRLARLRLANKMEWT